MIEIHEGDNLDVLARLADQSFDLVYVDPPFNTGREQRRTQLAIERVSDGDSAVDGADLRSGFGGHRYRATALGSRAFADQFDDYLAFLEPRLVAARRVLRSDGSFFLHLDWREVHYAKVLCDAIFGRASFMNEIVWAYDYGARSKRRWPAKHDTILWYAVDPRRYTFHYDAMERIPYMAPGLVSAEKAARGKTPTDVWWHTIVSPTGKEKTGYPTQKPLGVLRRIVNVHSDPGAKLLDFFAGSGTLGVAAAEAGRDCVLVDSNPAAIAVMRSRFAALGLDVRLPANSEPRR